MSPQATKKPPALAMLFGDLEARIRRLGRGTVTVTVGVLEGLPAWYRAEECRLTEDDWRRLMEARPQGKARVL